MPLAPSNSSRASSDAAFLESVLRSQTLDERAPQMSPIRTAFADVRNRLLASFPNVDVRLAGSIAKGTAIKAGHDVDLVCYFANEDTSAGETLEEIYDRVVGVLSSAYRTKQRRSAIRLMAPKVGTLPFTVDVVPGRFVDASRTDVFLHQTTGKKERLKTNLEAHLRYVERSGVRDAIRLAKIWKLRARLDVPTFVLELLCIQVLARRHASSIDAQLRNVWLALRDEVDELQVVDPANPTGNDLTTLLEECGEPLTSASTVALDLADQGEWATLFGNDTGEGDRAVVAPATMLRLGDTSHAHAVPWDTRRCAASARIVASVRRKFPWRPVERWRALESDAAPILEGSSLRFHAHVANVAHPYEVRWQVVNTGAHAQEVGGLRGNEFFAAKALDDPKRLSDDPHITHEKTEYTGKHWIECFIVKNGELWARSGRFLVNVINRSRRSRWFLG